MTPAAPTCATDFLWWAFLGVLSILGVLFWFLLKKGIMDRLDQLAANQLVWQENCQKCQRESREYSVPRSEYEKFLQIRQEAHQVINGRLAKVESGQEVISAKLSTFHNDLSEKITRLSMSFVIRDAVISTRVDNISHKVGIEWSKETEEKFVETLNAKVADLKN